MISEYSITRSGTKRKYLADFLLQQGEETLIIEIKNPVHSISRVLSSGTEQLMNYLTASGIIQGILYIPPMRKEDQVEISMLNKNIGEKIYRITQIYPKKRLDEKIQLPTESDR